MLDFRELTLADRSRVDEILKSENSRSADYNFGNMYMWAKNILSLWQNLKRDFY